MQSGSLPEPTVYRNWILSILPPSPDRPPIDLANDSKELLLMEVFEILRPGALDWKKIDLKPGNFYKKLSNLTILFEAMRDQSIVVLSIRPSDILEGKITSLYALLWNFMRIYFIDHVSQTKEIDDGAIVEWATNFRSPDIESQPCPRDEIINGDDKDFFYGTLINEEFGGEFPDNSKVTPSKSVTGCQFPQSENLAYFLGEFLIELRVAPRPLKAKNLERIKKPEILPPRSNLLDDIYEIVDMNFLSPEPVPKPVPAASARQSLLKISNLFGNIPAKTKDDTAPNSAIEPKIISENNPTAPSHPNKLTPIQIFNQKLKNSKLIKPQILEKWTQNDRLKNEAISFLKNMPSGQAESEEENSEFDVHSLLMEIKSDLGGQTIAENCAKISQTPDYQNLRQKLIQNPSKIDQNDHYPADFKFGKDFQKIFYKTLKNDFSSKTSISDIRKKSIKLFLEKNLTSLPGKESGAEPKQ